jgi:LacI family transcriptional regulator
MSSVLINNKAGGRLALKHLFDLGHRDIACIRGPKGCIDSVERWNGIVAYAREVGLTLHPDLVFELDEVNCSQCSFEIGRKLVQCRRRFSAVLAFDDMTAFGVIRALATVSRRVPQDCSVIGFDDIAMADCYNPPLTTVRQPLRDLGKMGVELLMQAISRPLKKAESTHLRVEPELVIRESTGRP